MEDDPAAGDAPEEDHALVSDAEGLIPDKEVCKDKPSLESNSKITLEFNNAKKLVLGLIIVIVIASSWVGSTQTAKSSYTGSFQAPFFIVFFTTSWMILCYPILLPVYWLLECRRGKRCTSPQEVIVSMWR